MQVKLQYSKADSRFLWNPNNVLSNETMLYSDEGTEKLKSKLLLLILSHSNCIRVWNMLVLYILSKPDLTLPGGLCILNVSLNPWNVL